MTIFSSDRKYVLHKKDSCVHAFIWYYQSYASLVAGVNCLAYLLHMSCRTRFQIMLLKTAEQILYCLSPILRLLSSSSRWVPGDTGPPGGLVAQGLRQEWEGVAPRLLALATKPWSFDRKLETPVLDLLHPRCLSAWHRLESTNRQKDKPV